MKYIPLITGIVILVIAILSFISTWRHNRTVLKEWRNSYSGSFYALFMAIYAIALGVVVLCNT